MSDARTRAFYSHMAPKKRLNSRAKGARIERKAADFLRSLGFVASRNARNGLSAADLDCSDCPVLSRVWLEVKGDRSIGLGTKALDDAFEQAREARAKSHPDTNVAVLWYEHRRGWRLTWVDRVQVTTAGDERIKEMLIALARGRGEEGK